MGHRRRASVIIATYNSADLLSETLRQLARQTIPTDDFEVIVGDDGSTDHTAEVVRSYADLLHIKYFFQEDQGFRVASARNGAARMAVGALLVILDTGSMVGPEFLAAHLAAHEGGESRRAVVGPSYGYNPDVPMVGVDELLAQMPPELVVERYRHLPEFQDVRQPYFVGCDMDLRKRSIPWQAFWTGNCSIRMDDFRRVGAFEERFQGWGGEDMELGFRLHRAGLTIELATEAWAVVAPHDRDHKANFDELFANMRLFLSKFPEPAVEMGLAVMVEKGEFWQWEPMYLELLDWQQRARGLSVSDEIADALMDVPDGEAVTIIGCGGELPASLTGATVVDFDHELLERAVRSGDHSGYHALGLATTLSDDSAGTVVITSRMAGLWATWGPEILAEAGRIGRRTISYASPVTAPAHSQEIHFEGRAA
ncbi:glycosyltransferase [Micromonospora sp. MH99]|uniref:glycosyltransferase n=1 Tax=Micromonospora sp. MH99 TaxID=1945510 RepID=UPI001F213669|nr:glycosyltransferase [Micromonospora sp. MH99]MCF0093059.1 Chondroitin synthase [Micromonospora sp. MH99]